MSYNWHAKVHKSGSKIAVFNGPNLVKVVESSKETFEPCEAQKFAEDIVKELESRTSAQMTEPSEKPAVATGAELQDASMEVVKTQAEGKSPGDRPAPKIEVEKISIENEELKEMVSSLKKKLSKERNERAIERKARRGLAIAKQLVVEGKLEDSYESIKNKVAQIVKLEDSEIDRLERKTAGEHEFETIEDAQKELRRQTRIARINRQAAAEAQEDGDEEQADSLDSKAEEAEIKVSHIKEVIEEMQKTSNDDDIIDNQIASTEEPMSTEEKMETPAVEEAKTTEEKMETPATEEPKTTEATVVEETKTTETPVVENKLSELARSYRVIAANHRKLAEEAEQNGDIKTADEQDALGDEAEERAEEIEKKLSECTKTSEETPVVEEEQTEVTQTAPEEQVEEKKEAIKKEPGKTITSSKHNPLKREDGEVVEESFGIDKNASLVEQNDYSSDPEVDVLSKMWRGAPKDIE